MNKIRAFHLPNSENETCGLSARVAALEGKVENIETTVGNLSAEVSELSIALKETVDRSESLNIEMGKQLQRFAELTDKNIKRTEDDNKLRVKLELLFDVIKDSFKR
jgi:regulator of replication initiation timing